LVIASLMMMTFGIKSSPPSQAEVEALARGYGMVYEDEVLVFGETAKPREEIPAEEPEQVETPIIQVSIPKGSSASKISELLLEKGVISDKMEFKDRVYKRNVSSKLGAGIFQFAPNLTVDEVIDNLLIPEGGDKVD
jgi:cell division protein YceG involved in septum cleavage